MTEKTLKIYLDTIHLNQPNTVVEVEAKQVLELFSHDVKGLLEINVDGETISVTAPQNLVKLY